MISLRQFILESVKETRILKDPEAVIEFFNLNKDDENDKEIIEQVKSLFDLAPYDENNNPVSPFVGGYKAEKGWCFRRWCQNNPQVEKIVNSITEGIEKKGGYKFKDYHNTNLEKVDAFPSSTQQEYFMAMSLNIKALFKDKKDLTDDDINNALKYALFGDKEKLTDKDKAIFNKYKEYYKQHSEYINTWADEIEDVEEGELFTKCPSTAKVSDDWADYGASNNTPKADIISNKGKKISLKKCDGAQAMSGGFNETMATLLSYKDLLADEEDREKLNSLFFDENGDFRSWKGKDENDRNKQLNDIIQDIFKNGKNKKFMIAVLTESVTGYAKFGEESDSSVNQIISWDPGKKLIQDDVNSYIYNAYKIMSGKKNNSFTINYKSSGNSIWSVLRIILPKHNEKAKVPEGDKEFEEIKGIINDVRNHNIKKNKERVELEDEDGNVVKVTIHTGPKGGRFYISPKSKNPVYVEKDGSGKYIRKSK